MKGYYKLKDVVEPIRIDQKYVDSFHEHFQRHTRIPEILLAESLEHHGGECPLCKKPWRELKARHEKEPFADFHFFEPDCKCFKTCKQVTRMIGKRNALMEGCGKLLVEEKFLKATKCLNCGGIIL